MKSAYYSPNLSREKKPRKDFYLKVGSFEVFIPLKENRKKVTLTYS